MRTIKNNCVGLAAGLVFSVASMGAQAPGRELPNAPGRDTVQRICGGCHSPDMVRGRGRTREQWSEVVSSMIGRGAKGTPEEFSQVIDYLANNLGPNQTAANSASQRGHATHRFEAGPNDEQVADASAAARGQSLYKSDCAGCHGPMARGGSEGPDLVRSVIVLHDRYGSALGPFLLEHHALPNGRQLPPVTENQIKALSNFLHQQVSNTLRSGPYTKVLNVMTGDAVAGAAYFNGAGGCNKCHSPAGDLAGVASRYDAATLQQRFLFPRAAGFTLRGFTPTKPVTVTVTAPDGSSIAGTLVRMDDFNISLRDAGGNYRSWKRTPELKIEKHDPYAAHDELLDKYTDRDIHNVVAYLETLK
jgi:cytochrome c oxidase cbb3-type subunit 3